MIAVRPPRDRMIVDALVPVKGMATGKNRLAPLLSPAERAALVRAMLLDVLAALLGADRLQSVAVVSPDAAVLELALQLGAVALQEPAGVHGLNAALAYGIARLRGRGDAVLVVPGDVPEIRSGDVLALAAPPLARGAAPLRGRQPLVRAVPAHDGGTGALLLSPAQVIAPAFGTASFARHQAAARAAGVPFERRELPSLARDLDRPRDVEQFLREKGQSQTRALLLQLGPFKQTAH